MIKGRGWTDLIAYLIAREILFLKKQKRRLRPLSPEETMYDQLIKDLQDFSFSNSATNGTSVLNKIISSLNTWAERLGYLPMTDSFPSKEESTEKREENMCIKLNLFYYSLLTSMAGIHHKMAQNNGHFEFYKDKFPKIKNDKVLNDRITKDNYLLFMLWLKYVFPDNVKGPIVDSAGNRRLGEDFDDLKEEVRLGTISYNDFLERLDERAEAAAQQNDGGFVDLYRRFFPKYTNIPLLKRPETREGEYDVESHNDNLGSPPLADVSQDVLHVPISDSGEYDEERDRLSQLPISHGPHRDSFEPVSIQTGGNKSKKKSKKKDRKKKSKKAGCFWRTGVELPTTIAREKKTILLSPAVRNYLKLVSEAKEMEEEKREDILRMYESEQRRKKKYTRKFCKIISPIY